ncbi:DNA (cytosine-5-)-methyltransferase [Nocardioides sp. NPDC006303]|uniref:DNA (cytosine-5-)-methyltransferase n=1 Tax=Nocardioides sp. NPDC006303 TaxID=3156747 RepID=UPI0033AD7BF1
MAFSFADLFAGIGGFHAAFGAMGGEMWFASEIDRNATAVYDYNWCRPLRTGSQDDRQKRVHGDIVPLTEGRIAVPPTDVLAGGFPCQPFSKSGFQRGIEETRGTLFWNIARILEEHQPSVIFLENVRNLAGPNHRDTWATIVRTLRTLGYRVASRPAIFSPHLLPPDLGGRPQVRERVFILAHKVKAGAPKDLDDPIVTAQPVGKWDPQSWDLRKHLPLQAEDEIEHLDRYSLSRDEVKIINEWERLLLEVAERLGPGERLPGFPIWADHFRSVEEAEAMIDRADLDETPIPKWKRDFLRKNAMFYERHRDVIDPWLPGIADFPPSRRKFEWQAQDPRPLDDTIMHFRPSGVRVKQPTYVPALVAITQTSIIGKSRRITPREAARLQGLPDWFEFKHEGPDGTVYEQPDAASYKQMGNGVNVGAVFYAFRKYVLEHQDEIAETAPNVVEAVIDAGDDPDALLKNRPLHSSPLSVGPESGSRGMVDGAFRHPEPLLG